MSAPADTSGRTYCSTSARVGGVSSAPCSTCSTRPGQACIIVPPGAGYCPTRRSRFVLASVTLVAITPTTPDRVAAAAGFTAGSMATIGRENVWRRTSTAAPVAVLQATTTALAPRPISARVTAVARAWMKAGGRSP